MALFPLAQRVDEGRIVALVYLMVEELAEQVNFTEPSGEPCSRYFTGCFHV